MMPAFSFDNFLSWFVQVSAVASVGALLPKIFRIRHPRSHLVYCYALLVACVGLPLLQPWVDPNFNGLEAGRSASRIGTLFQLFDALWIGIAVWVLLGNAEGFQACLYRDLKLADHHVRRLDCRACRAYVGGR